MGSLHDLAQEQETNLRTVGGSGSPLIHLMDNVLSS